MYQNPTGLPYCEQPPVLGVLSCQWLPNNQKSISPFRKHSQCCGFLCSFPFPFLFSPFPFSFFSFLLSPFLSLFFPPFSTTLLSSSPFLLYHHYYYCSPYYIQHKTSGCASPVWMVPSMGCPDSPASNWLWIRLVALTVSFLTTGVLQAISHLIKSHQNADHQYMVGKGILTSLTLLPIPQLTYLRRGKL